MTTTAATELTLETLAGPNPVSFAISPEKQAVIGRGVGSDLNLMNDGVSRRHATIVRRGADWYVINHSERAGTFLNGVRLEESKPAVVVAGDLLRVGPWTFRVRVGRSAGSYAATLDDTGSKPRVERMSPAHSRSDRRLKLLGEFMGRLAASTDEKTLAMTLLESAIEGSGYARGAVLRRVPGGQDVELVESLRRRENDAGEFVFSRSLVNQAAGGELAVLTGTREVEVQHSIADLRIHSALCAPIHLGGAVEGFMYLDARGQETSVHAEAAGFCEAIARAYGLAIANLKRVELQQRQRALELDLQAAREAQEVMLPARRAQVGPIRYAMEMRPGLFVAGDLFDVVSLPDGRVAVSVGDVAGHGLGSGMLMALAQSYLHAQILACGDPLVAVREVNRYVCDRAQGGRFASLWVGVFENAGDGLRVRYVDAGHGHWVHWHAGSANRIAESAGGLPIGIDPVHAYEAGDVMLGPGDRLILYSDGIVEKRSPAGEMFGLARVLGAVLGSPSSTEDVTRTFGAFDVFGVAGALDDDATVASIEFAGS